MKLSAKSGATIAATAAALLIGGAAIAPSGAVAADKVQCFGVNACKGHGACKTAKNACKGQGFVQMTKADCKAKGGTTKQS